MDFAELVGMTFSSIVNDDDTRIVFTRDDGKEFVLFHHQDCCESVVVEDIVGDLNDLVGSPILVAEESVSNERPADVKSKSDSDESETWTFYKLATIKGNVTIRWCGSSNGYYSESVDLEELQP